MPIPFPFVLDELQDLNPRTRAMFGCTAVYIGLKLVLIMRNKDSVRADNGVWLATTHEHHASLKKEFPHMRSLTLFGKKPTRWQILPLSSRDFESSVVHACELIRSGDPRLGTFPAPRKQKKTRRSPQRTSGRPARNKKAIKDRA